MPRRTKEEAEKTRLHLLDTALRLFAEKGVANTTLKEVAAESGVTHGALYWHFKNRTDLTATLYDECRFPIDDLYIDHLQSARQNALEALEEFLYHWCTLIIEDERASQIWQVFHVSQENAPELYSLSIRIEDEHEEWLEYLARFIKQGRKQNLISHKSAKKDPLPGAALAVVIGAIETAGLLKLEKNKRQQMIKQLIRSFLNGVGD